MALTQLSAQLKNLQAPQTDLFSEKRIRPSILFSAQEAANCNRETFYKIGNIFHLKVLFFMDNYFIAETYTISRLGILLFY